MFAQQSKPTEKKTNEIKTQESFKSKAIQRRDDKTKLPESLELGTESLNGQSLNDTQVQLNSPESAVVQPGFLFNGSFSLNSPLTKSLDLATNEQQNSFPINTAPKTAPKNEEPLNTVSPDTASSTTVSPNTETDDSSKLLPAENTGAIVTVQLNKDAVTQEIPKTEQASGNQLNLNIDSSLDDKADDLTGVPSSAKLKQAETGKPKTDADTTPNASATALTSTSSDAFVHALTDSSPTEFIVGASQADTIVNNLHQQEAKSTQRALPKLPAPTGLPRSNAKGTKTTQQAVPKTQSQADIKVTGEAKSKLPPVTHKAGESRLRLPPTPKPNVNETQSSGVDALNVRATIASLPTSNASINTDLGSAPQLQLDGQADPVHNQRNQQQAMQDVKRNKLEANAQTQADFGEHAIYPDVKQETLSSKTKFSQPLTPNNAGITVPEGISPEVLQAFDTQAKTQLNQQMTGEVAKVEEAKNTRDADINIELDNTDTAIHSETERVKARQQQEQNKAQANVSKFRQDWQAENTQVAKQYKADAASAREKADAEISSEVNATDQKVARTFEEADKRVKTEETKAERKAQKVKAEAENKDEGFWSRLTSAVSSFFDKIKAGLNAIFDGLRTIVKGIIEVAKKAANAIIDLARKAVVGLIKAFGEALKALINVALAAFPNIAKKFNRLIDQAVAKASQAVNLLAEGLKKAVSVLLDVLGKVVDTILAVYQAVYNAILDVVAFIAVGMVKVLQFLSNLVVGAALAPTQVLGELAKEAIGGNPAEPLPNFEVPQGQEKNWAVAMGLEKTSTEAIGDTSEFPSESQAVSAGVIPEQLAPLLTKSELADSDVIVDPFPALTLEPELIASLPPLAEGETLELGGAGSESVTTKAFQATAAQSAGLISTNEQQSGNVGSIEVETPLVSGQQGSEPDWRSLSDDSKLDYYLKQMNTETTSAAAQQPSPPQKKVGPPVVDNSPAALIRKTGRLSAGRRLAFMGNQMITGISVMWNKYKAWIIAGLVTALLAAGAIAFFTGGAGLAAALNIAMQAMIVIFGAIAVFRASGQIGEYIKQSWNGNAEAAGKALAKAFAIIFVEFFIDKVLLGMGKVFKRILKAARATRVGRALGRVAKAGRKASSSAGKFLKKGVAKVKGNKLVIGFRRKIGKGVKKLQDLRRRILERFGFKRVWMERHGKWIEVWGEFNAKSMLIRKEVDTQGNTKFTHELAGGNGSLAGKTGQGSGVRNLNDQTVIGGRPNRATDELIVSDELVHQLDQFKISNPSKHQKILKELDDAIINGKNKEELREIILKQTGEINVHPNLRRGELEITANVGEAKHHLIPVSSAKNSTALHRLAEKKLYNINWSSNGIALPTDAAESIKRKLPLHSGGHLDSYFKAATDRLSKLDKIADKLNDADLLKEVKLIEDRMRNDLLNGNLKLQNGGWQGKK